MSADLQYSLAFLLAVLLSTLTPGMGDSKISAQVIGMLVSFATFCSQLCMRCFH
jgi:hypothetical protein